MSFSMTMGNSRMDRIKVLQMEKERNNMLRKTGVQMNQSTFSNKPDTVTRQTKGILQYSQCPYCKQQILSNNLQHHINFCNSAFKPSGKGKCSACEQFRRK